MDHKLYYNWNTRGKQAKYNDGFFTRFHKTTVDEICLLFALFRQDYCTRRRESKKKLAGIGET